MQRRFIDWGFEACCSVQCNKCCNFRLFYIAYRLSLYISWVQMDQDKPQSKTGSLETEINPTWFVRNRNKSNEPSACNFIISWHLSNLIFAIFLHVYISNWSIYIIWVQDNRYDKSVFYLYLIYFLLSLLSTIYSV